MAAPFSLRAQWNARASAPFDWQDLDDIEPDAFRIDTILARLMVGDPFLPVARGPGCSLVGAMEALDLPRGG